MTQPDNVMIEERARRAHLANIRQELLAPVGAIVGYAEMLHEQSLNEDLTEMSGDLERVLTAARSLYDMVDKLLSGDVVQELFQGEDPEVVQQKLRHDLRTPINGIKGYSEMLVEDLEDIGGEHMRADFERLLNQVTHLLAQLGQIVDFTSQQNDNERNNQAKPDAAMITELLRSIKPVAIQALRPEETGRILVVDDMEPNRDLLSRRLERDGHRVETVDSGAKALNILKRQEFDLVLLDLMMPGMNGFEVLALMKEDEDLKALPVIMVSAFDETDSVVRCIEAGADDYLPKPINPILLRARIKSGLEKKAWQDQERQQKKFIRQAFSRYISPDVVDQLMEDPDRLSLGGERLDITCIFTDLAGFTTLMEEADPAVVLPVLNKYLDNMCVIVRDHGGTLDKIVGDALHVFFGAPLEMPDHPAKAVECALEMDAYAREFEASDEARAVNFGVTRIGVHSGLAVVGNFGGETFFDYTAHGDTVNTAARMEGVNKYLGTRLCVSGETAGRCTGIKFRPVGSLLLKGKSLPTEAFEPIADEAPLGNSDYMAAYDLMAAGDAAALDAFDHLTKSYPDDPLAKFHADRLAGGKISLLIELTDK